jgi:hypothetical protein
MKQDKDENAIECPKCEGLGTVCWSEWDDTSECNECPKCLGTGKVDQPHPPTPVEVAGAQYDVVMGGLRDGFYWAFVRKDWDFIGFKALDPVTAYGNAQDWLDTQFPPTPPSAPPSESTPPDCPARQ